MGGPGASRLVGGGAGGPQAGHEAPSGHNLYTQLMNAGLSPADVREVGDRIVARVVELLKKKALRDDPDEKRRYLNDHNLRHRINSDLFRQAISEVQFSYEELGRMDVGLGLGLILKQRKGPTIATVRGPDGRVEQFEIVENDASGRVIVRSQRDGRLTGNRPF